MVETVLSISNWRSKYDEYNEQYSNRIGNSSLSSFTALFERVDRLIQLNLLFNPTECQGQWVASTETRPIQMNLKLQKKNYHNFFFNELIEREYF